MPRARYPSSLLIKIFISAGYRAVHVIGESPLAVAQVAVMRTTTVPTATPDISPATTAWASRRRLGFITNQETDNRDSSPAEGNPKRLPVPEGDPGAGSGSLPSGAVAKCHRNGQHRRPDCPRSQDQQRLSDDSGDPHNLCVAMRVPSRHLSRSVRLWPSVNTLKPTRGSPEPFARSCVSQCPARSGLA